MPFKIVRNDITAMQCDAIVNTANEFPVVGRGCDTAVYQAAGYEELLEYRKQKIGRVKEGDAFITPGFQLHAKYIIHAVSPLWKRGTEKEEKKLRKCYQNSLELARQNGIHSIAFPLIATGSYHYPKEEGMRIAVDEINAFLLQHDMLIYLVVYDDLAFYLGKKLYPGLESYLDENYTGADLIKEEYAKKSLAEAEFRKYDSVFEDEDEDELAAAPAFASVNARPQAAPDFRRASEDASFHELHQSGLDERLKHLSDTFSEYLLYLIQSKGLTNAEVYKGAIVDKKVFSKIKNNKYAHPQKLTALCLCIGARLNLDECRDLLARAGYALSPSDKTDVIFSYFIEHQIYDIIELDIQLEEHGLPCMIS